MSQVEELLIALVEGRTSDIVPQSRVEACLKNLLDGLGTEGLHPPISRAEAFLHLLAEQGLGSSGSTEGVNKLAKVVDGTITELTAKDLQGATKIDQRKFHQCIKLVSAVIPTTVTYIGDYAFAGCQALTSIHIPKSVTTMRKYAFNNCSELASLTFDNDSQLTEIAEYTFTYDSALQSVTLPNNIKTIANYAFRNCTGLSSVSVGASVQSIGSQAFYDCTALKRFVLKATTPPSIQSNTFGNTHADCVFVVPHGCGDAYKTATNWSAFADQIIEGDA